METRFNKFVNEYNMFEDEHELVGDPPKSVLMKSLQHGNKYLIYTRKEGSMWTWMLADNLMKSYLDSGDFSSVKQVTVILGYEKVKKFGGMFRETEYDFELDNLKPFEFISKYNSEFK